MLEKLIYGPEINLGQSNELLTMPPNQAVEILNQSTDPSQLVILVHPFDSFNGNLARFHSYSSGKDSLGSQMHRLMQNYIARLTTFLSQTQQGRILVLEQADRVQPTLALIRQIGYQGNVLWYKTARSTPQTEDIYQQEGTQLLSNLLKMSLIQRIFVGGQYTSLSWNTEPKTVIKATDPDISVASGCVPQFISHLQHELQDSPIDIYLSTLTFPHNHRFTPRSLGLIP